MAEVKTEQEPSIEEILESIRQIIADDAEDKGSTEKPSSLVLQAVPEPKDAPGPELVLGNKEIPTGPAPVLDLTERVAPVEPRKAAPAPQPSPPPAPRAETPPAPASPPAAVKKVDTPMTDDKSKLMSAQTAAAATDAIAKLVDQAGLGEKAPAASGKVVVDIEEMTRDLMRPIIKEWLDKNLPGLIEKIVQKEIERLARQAQDR